MADDNARDTIFSLETFTNHSPLQTFANSIVGASTITLPVADEVEDARRYLAEYARWVVEHPGQQPPRAMRELQEQAERTLQVQTKDTRRYRIKARGEALWVMQSDTPFEGVCWTTKPEEAQIFTLEEWEETYAATLYKRWPDAYIPVPLEEAS